MTTNNEVLDKLVNIFQNQRVESFREEACAHYEAKEDNDQASIDKHWKMVREYDEKSGYLWHTMIEFLNDEQINEINKEIEQRKAEINQKRKKHHEAWLQDQNKPKNPIFDDWD
jgi:hypothetical protein